MNKSFEEETLHHSSNMVLIYCVVSTTPIEHQMYAWLVGFGVAGTGFGVILAVVGRASSDENRSMSLAVATAAGSAGRTAAGSRRGRQPPRRPPPPPRRGW